jgi:hypothetical protein
MAVKALLKDNEPNSEPSYEFKIRGDCLFIFLFDFLNPKSLEGLKPPWAPLMTALQLSQKNAAYNFFEREMSHLTSLLPA